MDVHWAEQMLFQGSVGKVKRLWASLLPVHHHALSLTTKAQKHPQAGILHKISSHSSLTRRFSKFSRLSQIGKCLFVATQDGLLQMFSSKFIYRHVWNSGRKYQKVYFIKIDTFQIYTIGPTNVVVP